MRGLVEEALAWGRRQGGAREAVIAAICDRLAVAFGTELAGIVPGRVSTEVDADLSFDTAATVDKARAIIAAYAARGVGRERILIKLASTWEGIRAAEVLQREGIDCNLTLLFSLAQAVACRRRGRVPDLALRRPHPRLARQGRRRALHRRDRSRRAVGPAHLRLLQGARHQDRGHGRLVPQRRRDRGPRRLRPPDDLAGAPRRACRKPRARCRARLSPESTAGAARQRRQPRREELPLPAQRGRHGDARSCPKASAPSPRTCARCARSSSRGVEESCDGVPSGLPSLTVASRQRLLRELRRASSSA